MPEPRSYLRYTFQGYSGHLVYPDTAAHELLMLRHSAQVAPWTDRDVHLHESSEEYYLLLGGELWFLVDGVSLDLQANEILMVKPGVPHSLVRGLGVIEHFGFRAPASRDRYSQGAIPDPLPPFTSVEQRELRQDWGYRIPLGETRNQNCWLIGLGAARFRSSDFLLAYLNFPTHEAANAGLGSRHRLHLHRESWEYYIVLAGTKTLQIEDKNVLIRPGEMVEVFPGVKHALIGRQAPYRGFTFRVPLRDDKVET